MLSLAQTAEILGVTIDEVLALVQRSELRGVRIGTPPQWRIDQASIEGYLDAQAELTRRAALWNQSQEASFPELWGTGTVRHSD